MQKMSVKFCYIKILQKEFNHWDKHTNYHLLKNLTYPMKRGSINVDFSIDSSILILLKLYLTDSQT